MFQYANGFSIAFDKKSEVVMISFNQRVPDFGDDDSKVKFEEVSSIVLGKVVAENLVNALEDIVQKSEEEK